MLSDKLEKAINKQINEELYSSYLYWSMASWFESKNLSGFANWMRIQSEEEYLHARKFYDFVFTAGGRVVFEEIKAPQKEWDSIEEVFQDTYNHEVFITNCINDLATLAMDDKNHATASFLKWFIDEQVEEVATADQILQEIKMIGDHKQGIFMLDREMKGRAPVLPASPAQ